MGAEEVENVKTSDAQWQRRCRTLAREGKSFKVVSLNTDDERKFVVSLGLKFGLSIAHGDGVAYISQTESEPGKAQRVKPEKGERRVRRSKNRGAKLFLVVEPDQDDATLIKRAFGSVDSCNAFICRNVSEGRAYLEGAGVYGNRSKYPVPNAVITELIIGTETALGLLRWLSAGDLAGMPVYILTASEAPHDLLIAKQSGATGVFQKPRSFSDLKAMLGDLAAKLCSK